MKFLEWKNKYIGEYDIFVIANKEEKNMIVKYFGTNKAESAFFPEEEEYFYFLNSIQKIITPMPVLSFAFGGMYNGNLPYGEQVKYFKFDITEYNLKLYE